jgi:hypothetical protein
MTMPESMMAPPDAKIEDKNGIWIPPTLINRYNKILNNHCFFSLIKSLLLCIVNGLKYTKISMFILYCNLFKD